MIVDIVSLGVVYIVCKEGLWVCKNLYFVQMYELSANFKQKFLFFLTVFNK